MKRFFKVFLAAVGLIVLAPMVVLGLYNFFALGQEDFGLVNEYHYCENGTYYAYPRGIMNDGSSTYFYRGDRELIATCYPLSLDLENLKVCAELFKLNKSCEVRGFKPSLPPWF
jgi:hypothetical protein